MQIKKKKEKKKKIVCIGKQPTRNMGGRGFVDLIPAVPDLVMVLWECTGIRYKWVVHLDDGSDFFAHTSRGEGVLLDRVLSLQALLLQEPRAFDSVTPAFYDIVWWLQGAHVDVTLYGQLQAVSRSWQQAFRADTIPARLRWRNRGHEWKLYCKAVCMYSEDHETLSDEYREYIDMGVGCIIPDFGSMD